MIQSFALPVVIAAALSVIASACAAADQPSPGGLGSAKSFRVYVGTYTGPKTNSKGIYLYDFDVATGALKQVGLAAETASPSFLAMSPDYRHLYAVGEVEEFGGKKTGVVSAFAVDTPSGKLSLLNQQPSGGLAPCHVSLTSDGKHALVANYSGGSVASFAVDTDGKLKPAASVVQHIGKGTDPGRQDAPHAHGIWPAPGDVFVVACDLGLDKVMIYRLDGASGKLTLLDRAGDVPPGAGARHAAFSPSGDHLYAINEMGNTVTAFEYDRKAGALTPIQTIGTLPQGFSGKSYTSEIVFHPSGKFVYGSNRGHDSIAVFAVDPASGKLTLADVTPIGGKWPRHFNVDPTGQWLIAAGERSDTLTVFKIDSQTGKLAQSAEPVAAPSPVCVIFAPKP
jgi:6-phosphogluconolactonase